MMKKIGVLDDFMQNWWQFSGKTNFFARFAVF
jgi:hypothetical protein